MKKRLYTVSLLVLTATLSQLAIAEVKDVQQNLTLTPYGSKSVSNPAESYSAQTLRMGQRDGDQNQDSSQFKNKDGFLLRESNDSQFIQIQLLKRKASRGGVSTGGGDEYVADFMQTLVTEVHPWIKANQDIINPEKLLSAADPQRIISVDRVFESCRFSTLDIGKSNQKIRATPVSSKDSLREACYNQDQDRIYISRESYPLNVKRSPAKLKLISHELLRRLGLEGNDYLISRQWDFAVPAAEDSAISEGAYSMILSTAAVMDELVAKASEVCDSRSGNLSPDWVADKLIQVKTRAAAINKIFESIGRTTNHFQPCSRENGVSAYMDVLSIDPFLDYAVKEARFWGQTYNSGLPACRVRDNFLKDWKVETDGAVEYATQYRSGVRTPLENCVPANRK